MRKIEVDKSIRRIHRRYWKEKVLPNIRSGIKKYKTKNKKVAKYLEFCIKYWRALAVGNIDVLRKFERKLESRGERYNFKKFNKKSKDDILKYFGYEKFSEEKGTEKIIRESVEIIKNNMCKNNDDYKRVKWTPYVLLFLLPIRTCPYCNRQYITPIYKDDISDNGSKKMRADLDHFWSKSQYPHFSMSLYNLVPSCKFCNSSLKGNRDFSLDTLSPYECNYDECFHFDIDYGNFDIDSLHVEIILDDSKIAPVTEMFALKEVYCYHDNVLKDFVQKRICYPNELLEDLLIGVGENNHYDSIDELKAVLLGFPASKGKIIDEPLGKLRYDIASRLGFL